MQLSQTKPLSAKPQTESHAPGLTHKETGMLVAIASFGMLFGTMFFTYLLARERFPAWPPIGVETLKPLLPTLSTGVLVASSLIIHRAQQLFYLGQKPDFQKFWIIGTALGFGFLILQVTFWKQMLGLGVYGNDGHLFGAVFYTLTGLHAFHILGGLGSLVWVIKRTQNTTDFSAQNESPKLVAWFWHFLDVIWILMFFLLVFY